MIVVMQIWDGDKELSVHTARAIRNTLPSSKIGVLANKCEHPKELEDYCDLIQTTSDDLHMAGGLAVHELLVLALRMSGSYILKVDPDCTFGTPQPDLEETLLSQGHGVKGRVFSVAERKSTGILEFMHYAASGFFGMDRPTARRFVDEGILLSPALLAPSELLELRRHNFSQFHGRGSHSWPLGLACNKLDISPCPSPELSEFIQHPLNVIRSVDGSDLEAQRKKLSDSPLLDEINSLSKEEIGLKFAVEFVSEIWGSLGVTISQRQDDENRIAHKNSPFSDFESALSSLRTGIFQHNVITAKPLDESGVRMVILDVPSGDWDTSNASVVATSFNARQLFFTMQDPISDDAANKLIDEASFADKRSSRTSTLLHGVRLPGTACYEDVCLHRNNSDFCEARKVLSDDKVRLVKFVDKFFTYDEALDVIRGLAKSYKVPPPVTELEPALP